MTICDMGPIKRLLSFLTHPWCMETEEARHSCPPPPNHHLCQDCCVMASQWHSGLSLWAPDASDTVAAKYRKWGPGDGIESNQVYWAGGTCCSERWIFLTHTQHFLPTITPKEKFLAQVVVWPGYLFLSYLFLIVKTTETKPRPTQQLSDWVKPKRNMTHLFHIFLMLTFDSCLHKSI